MFVFREGNHTALNISAPSDTELARGLKQQRGLSLHELQAGLHKATHTKLDKGKLVQDRSIAKTAAPKRNVGQKNNRGLIVEDAESSAGSELKRIASKFDPQPAMSLFIKYYTGPTSPN
jgi:hypothetical protein